MRKKFTVYDKLGLYKPKEGEMLVMNSSGVFFLVSGLNDYYTNIQRLYDVIGSYDVVWEDEC